MKKIKKVYLSLINNMRTKSIGACDTTEEVRFFFKRIWRPWPPHFLTPWKWSWLERPPCQCIKAIWGIRTGWVQMSSFKKPRNWVLEPNVNKEDMIDWLVSISRFQETKKMQARQFFARTCSDCTLFQWAQPKLCCEARWQIYTSKRWGLMCDGGPLLRNPNLKCPPWTIVLSPADLPFQCA